MIANAPAWTLRDVDGREVRSADFAGKVIVVDFWATWCPPCLEEIPGYIALQKKYAAQGLVILGLSVDAAGVTVVKNFATGHQMNYPVLMADDSTVKAFGGVSAIPTTFLIDRLGRIRHRKVGTAAPDWYDSVVASVLKEAGLAEASAASPAATPVPAAVP